MDNSTEHSHPLHVGVLSLHIGFAHEYLTLHVHKGTHCSGGDAMLTCACLGYDAPFAHLAGEQYLSDGVVDFVCPSVIEVFSLQVELASISLAHP